MSDQSPGTRDPTRSRLPRQGSEPANAGRIESSRRRVLAASFAVGATLLAGCSSVIGGETLYDEREEHEMFLEASFFGDGWHEHTGLNDYYDVVYGDAAVPEEISDLVMARVDIYDDVETAEEWMDQSRQRFQGQHEYDLADEAFWDTQNSNAAYAYFRHLNARGQVLAARERSTVRGLEVTPWQAMAVEAAEAMFERWQDI